MKPVMAGAIVIAHFTSGTSFAELGNQRDRQPGNGRQSDNGRHSSWGRERTISITGTVANAWAIMTGTVLHGSIIGRFARANRRGVTNGAGKITSSFQSRFDPWIVICRKTGDLG